jgi:hypothetical protein
MRPSGRPDRLSEHVPPSLPVGSATAADILWRAQTGQSLIQDFCPLADSIEGEKAGEKGTL